MKRKVIAACVAILLPLAGCNEKKAADAMPPPRELNAAATGHYCGMNILEHAGPKGQIILASVAHPIWFSSARDAISFTMLPEEPKDIRAIYVSDMAKAPNWEEPGSTNWMDAKKGFFVIESKMKGGMGADEAIPFSTREAADKFAQENGGRVATFAEIPRDYILGSSGAPSAALDEPGGADKGSAPQSDRPATHRH